MSGSVGPGGVGFGGRLGVEGGGHVAGGGRAGGCVGGRVDVQQGGSLPPTRRRSQQLGQRKQPQGRAMRAGNTPWPGASAASSSSPSSKAAAVFNAVLAMLSKQWFLVGLVASILFARLAPDIGAAGGPLKPEYTVKYGAVFLIFFNSGLTLKSEELKKAAMQISVHSVIQGFTLCVVPIAMSFIVPVLRNMLDWNPAIFTGLSVLSCLPPPVSSAVILTSAAGGNEAAAIFNSAFGSFLGIVATPLLLFTVVGQSAGVPVEKIFMSLTATVVVPLILGQLVRYRAWHTIKPLNIPFSTISSSVLLLIIYCTFCQTFKAGVDIDGPTLLGVVAFIVALLLAEMVLLFVTCTRLGFAPRDVVCILFCATHKSLTLGIPMLNIVFAGHTALSLLSVPILIYHPAQILLGGLLVPFVQKWLRRQQQHSQDRGQQQPRLERTYPGSNA